MHAPTHVGFVSSDRQFCRAGSAGPGPQLRPARRPCLSARSAPHTGGFGGAQLPGIYWREAQRRKGLRRFALAEEPCRDGAASPAKPEAQGRRGAGRGNVLPPGGEGQGPGGVPPGRGRRAVRRMRHAARPPRPCRPGLRAGRRARAVEPAAGVRVEGASAAGLEGEEEEGAGAAGAYRSLLFPGRAGEFRGASEPLRPGVGAGTKTVVLMRHGQRCVRSRRRLPFRPQPPHLPAQLPPLTQAPWPVGAAASGTGRAGSRGTRTSRSSRSRGGRRRESAGTPSAGGTSTPASARPSRGPGRRRR